jgi:hypothetical protein
MSASKYIMSKAEVKLRQPRLKLLSTPVNQRCGDVEAVVTTLIREISSQCGRYAPACAERVQPTSAFGGKADITRTSADVR